MEPPSTQRKLGGQALSPTVLDRGLDVLEALLAEAPSASLDSLAARVGMPKPTLHRILATLVRRGYAVQTLRGTYGPGAQVFTGAGWAHRAIDYSQISRPFLQQLRERTNDTVHFGLRIGDEVIYTEKLEAHRPYRMVSRIGTRLSLHCTAIGKVILAYSSDSATLLETLSLPRHTSNTITDMTVLAEALHSIRLHGFAIDDEENEDGVRCVGAPVFDYRGEAIGAISVSAPAILLDSNAAVALAPEVIAAAGGLSVALGASAPVQGSNGDRKYSPMHGPLFAGTAPSVKGPRR